MVYWTPYAFVRFFFCFTAGILTGIHFPAFLNDGQSWYMLVLLSMAFVWLGFFSKLLLRRPACGATAMLILFISGHLHSLRSDHRVRETHIIHLEDSITAYRATLTTIAEQRERSWKQTASVNAIRTAVGWRRASGKLLLYFDVKGFERPFSQGDEVMVRGRPSEIEPPRNPHQFDYRRFLSRKNIFHQHFVAAGHATVLDVQPFFPGVHIDRLRVGALSVFDRFVEDDESKAVASALVLGYRDGLDDEISASFAAAGAMHILAVSGLHVGLVYGLIIFLLNPLKRVPNGKWIIAFTSLVLLWGYASLTGLSPSAVRAAAMFSFFALAVPWRKRTQPYNTLAVSAFFMLLFDPFLIMSVGFQLSYLAVLGIVYGYRRLVILWEAPTWLLDRLWKMTCVSISAQLATLPVSILYFHQVPVYALVANLVVIPLAFGILITGLLLVAIQWVMPLAAWVATILSIQLQVLLKTVYAVEQLPGSSITGIYITPFQCILIFAMGISILLLFEIRKFAWVYVVVFLAAAFAWTQWEQEIRWGRNGRLVVYDIPGRSVVDLLEGRRIFSFCDSATKGDLEKAQFYVSENRMANGMQYLGPGENMSFVRTVPGGIVIRWKEATILHIREPAGLPSLLTGIDYVVVSNNAVNSLSEITDRVKARHWIVDSSNQKWLIERWAKEAITKNLNLHVTAIDGAFEINL